MNVIGYATGFRPGGHKRFDSIPILGSLLGAFKPVGAGDPDGAKARLAGERARKTQPLPYEHRLSNYAWQDDTPPLVRMTPARRRRCAKKLRATGNPSAIRQAELLKIGVYPMRGALAVTEPVQGYRTDLAVIDEAVG